MIRFAPMSNLMVLRKLLSTDATRASCLIASNRLSSKIALGGRKGSLWSLYSFPLDMFDASALEYVLQSGDTQMMYPLILPLC